jgi:putative chitinase
MQLTSDQLSQIAIYAGANRIATYLPLINATLDKYSIDTPLRVCHFLAQLVHESGSFVYTTEQDSGEAYEGRADLGNTQPGDGPLFKGRGFIQLTGRANYQAYSDDLGVDVVSDPDQVADHYPADVSGWFWNKHNLNALADQDGLTAITEVINGGTNGLSDRLFWLGKAKNVLMPVA